MSQSSFSAAISSARAAGRDLLDLTVSNPTRCGFTYAPEVLSALAGKDAAPHALAYDPDPLGMASAREAVSRYYSSAHGATVAPGSIVLTASTSEAYSFLFRLLCDPGDEVLVAQPSYPLFDFLAALDDVLLKPYPLLYDYGWWIDFSELERRIGPRTRAIILVHPNNPTGHWTHVAEREKLEALCESHGLALIVDEVFLDYPIARPGNLPARSFANGPHSALTFVLSGLSKIAALPQMKVAWLAVHGPALRVEQAMMRLEIIADTFLSVNTPSQLALPTWLATATPTQDQIKARVAANLHTLTANGLECLRVEAGWSAILRLRSSPNLTAETLMDCTGVLVHPGEFYGLPDNRDFVISLITPAAVFAAATRRITELE